MRWGQNVLGTADLDFEQWRVAVGDVALVDTARPGSYFADNGGRPWSTVTLNLQRQSLVAHLGFDPRGGLFQSRGRVGRAFAPRAHSAQLSRHADELFARIRRVIKDRFADPDFGPRRLALETGISLRYVHKLFTQRSWTCGEFIYSLRSDHAARLLHRRGIARHEPATAHRNRPRLRLS